MNAGVKRSFGDALAEKGEYLAKVIRGGKPAPEKRWSSTYVLNFVSITAIVLIILFEGVISHWRVGLNTQEIKCLPGTAFLVKQTPPDEILRGQIIAYRSSGLTPFLEDGRSVAKIVAALPGDTVVVDAEGIAINGKYWGPLNKTVLDKSGRSVESVSKSYVVGKGELLLLGTLPRSYDGRYWGTIKTNQVIGKAWRLW